MQISRLFEIIYILLDKKKVTTAELAEHFEVSRRTICRDLDVLSSAGIPLYTDKGRNGGISLMDSFVLDKSALSEGERQVILASLQSLNALNYPMAEPILSKLQSLFCKSDNSWIEVDFSHWGSGTEEQDKFEKIKNAILEHRTIVFEYFNSYGEQSSRKVDPLKLWFKEKFWYLKAYCHKHGDDRIFKITRIRKVQLCEEHFTRELSTAAEEKEKPNYETIALKLKISAEAAYRVYDEFGEKDFTKDEEGNFIVNVAMMKNDWVYGYILSFGANVEVIEPIFVRNTILKMTEDIQKKYI